MQFLIKFNEASALKARKASHANSNANKERFFSNDSHNEMSVAKAIGTAFAVENTCRDNEETEENDLIQKNFTKWNKKQYRELWETVRWAFCLPETLQSATNIAPEDLITKGKIYFDRLLGGINFTSKSRK